MHSSQAALLPELPAKTDKLKNRTIQQIEKEKEKEENPKPYEESDYILKAKKAREKWGKSSDRM